jgi:CheY-like chemotaxis protein
MTKKSIKVLLLVEDNPGDARLLREMLNEQGLHDTEMTHVARLSEAEQHLESNKVDIILLDLGLPDANGLSAVWTTNYWWPKLFRKERRTISSRARLRRAG